MALVFSFSGFCIVTFPLCSYLFIFFQNGGSWEVVRLCFPGVRCLPEPSRRQRRRRRRRGRPRGVSVTELNVRLSSSSSGEASREERAAERDNKMPAVEMKAAKREVFDEGKKRKRDKEFGAATAAMRNAAGGGGRGQVVAGNCREEVTKGGVKKRVIPRFRARNARCTR